MTSSGSPEARELLIQAAPAVRPMADTDDRRITRDPRRSIDASTVNALELQRIIAERLVLTALREQDLTGQAVTAGQRADAANLAKSVFLQNMSHELLTPLNAIGGYTALLEMGLRGPVTADQQADLARIRANQAHLLGLISEILTFVQSGSGHLEYRFTAVSVRAALSDVSEMLQGSAGEQQLVLVDAPGEADVTVWADAGRVRQILLNLVMNAVKYASASGGRITLGSVRTLDHVAIHVNDNGPGIPAANCDTIFDPFVQLSSGLTNRRGGVGLGLAISRDLARGMRGELTVDSTIGVGSRFVLTLPRRGVTPE